MTFAWFLTARNGGAAFDAVATGARLAAVADAIRSFIHTPATTNDPYLDDGAPPALVMEMHFATIESLEDALRSEGGLAEILRGSDASWREQAMLARAFPVPVSPRAADRTRCTYLVAYEGQADDLNAWLSHYIAHHPPIMARFPGIREIAVYSRVDWCSGLGVARADAFQRNKVVFDDAAALTAALNSPVRHEMRADFHAFPKFAGSVTHSPMMTRQA